MRTKQTIAVVSSSALAAGMAHGAVHYVQENTVFPLPSTPANTSFDINGDGTNDLMFGFDGATTANPQKPYVAGMPSATGAGSAVLSRYNIDSSSRVSYGNPVTAFGTMIDSHYLTPAATVNSYGISESKGFLDQDGNGNYVGDWHSGIRTEGYVGVELYDASNTTTNFGWLHLIFDGTASPVSLTLVESGYEDIPGAGIAAGATNELGAPVFYAKPASQAVSWGATVQLQSLALGAPAPTFQWRARAVGSGVFTNLTDGGVISGATTSNLTINGASALTMLDYVVVVSNSLGAITSSPPATLTVVPPAATPTPQVLYAGLAAKFNVSVAAGLSPTYGWRRNGVNLSDGSRIAGSTTSHMQVSNIQAADAGSYDVVLTLGSLSVTSSVSKLTVLPAQSESTYQSVLFSEGPWAYYALNEMGDPMTNNLMAYDNVGGFNGIYGTNVVNGFSGVAGPGAADGFSGFGSNNMAASFSPYTPYSWIPVAPWNLNTDTATFLAWVKPADQQYAQGTVVSEGTSSSSSAGIAYHFQYNQDTFNFDVGYLWQDGTASCVAFDSGLCPPFGQWSMVAAVITPRAGTVYVFNPAGVGIATNDGTTSFLSFNPFTNQVMAFATSEYIGTDYGDTSGARNFYGAVDEVAVFKKALSQDQLQTIFNAALGIAPPPPVTLQIGLAGNNVQVTWPSGQLLEAPSVNGPWTTNSLAVSPYTVQPTNHSKFYRAQAQ